MQELYFTMIAELTKAVDVLCFPNNLIEEDEIKIDESARCLNARLMQLNEVINTEFTFPTGTRQDIVDYFKLLKEYEKDISDIVEYTLSGGLHPDGTYEKHQRLFMEEVLNGIICYSSEISNFIPKS